MRRPAQSAGVALAALALLPGLTGGAAAAAASAPAATMSLGRLSTGATVTAVRGPAGWGLQVTRAGRASALQLRPVELEATASTADDAPIRRLATGYSRLRRSGARTVVGTARLRLCACASFLVTDRWTVSGSTLTLSRRLTVRGSARGGFASGARLVVTRPAARSQVDHFVPGQLYGPPTGLFAAAPGGVNTFLPGHSRITRLREDRLTLPLYGVRFADGSSLTALDPRPDGRTVAADTEDRAVTTVIAPGIHVSSLEVDHHRPQVAIGGWTPGSELESTYIGGGFTKPVEERPRRRYQPIRDGLVQRRVLAFRFGRGQSWPRYQDATLRAAHAALAPTVPAQDVEAARTSVAALVESRIVTTNGRTGIPLFANAVTGEPIAKPGTGSALMGFVGRNLELAQLLLQDSEAHPGPATTRRRELAGRLVDSFTLLPMDPPVGEGFDLETGRPVGYPEDAVVHLRPRGDDMEAVVKAAVLARRAGVDPSAGASRTPSSRSSVSSRAGRRAAPTAGWPGRRSSRTGCWPSNVPTARSRAPGRRARTRSSTTRRSPPSRPRPSSSRSPRRRGTSATPPRGPARPSASGRRPGGRGSTPAG